MKTLVVFIFALLACLSAGDYRLSTEGMQGLYIRCKNDAQLLLIRSFENIPGFDFMKMTRNLQETIDVLVEADKSALFKNYLKANNIDYTIFTENFQDIINDESTKQWRMKRSVERNEGYNFKHFPRHNEINNYLKNITSRYNNLVTIFNIGKTYEGRDMLGVKISTGGHNKPAILIDAGIHAREWIAPTTALYFISQLVKTSNRHLLEKVDFHIIPNINPDGYEYSHTSDRMWRKSRGHNSTSSCRGTDLNRNFGYKWNTVGTISNNPCSEIYVGKKAFSEVESQNVRDYLLALNGTVKVYLSFHSYGQYLLHPWGYTEKLPENEPTLRNVAEQAARAIADVRGKRYKVGSSTILLYAASGGSDDWAMTVGQSDLAYTVELPGGHGGFIINPSEIVPVGHETFQGLKEFVKYAESV